MANTLEALAGAFLLNAVHYPSVKKLWKLGELNIVIKTGEGWRAVPYPERVFDKMLEAKVKDLEPMTDMRLETPLFLFENIRETAWEHPRD